MISKERFIKVLSLTLLANFSFLSMAISQSQTTQEKPEAHWQEAGLPFIQNFDPKEYNASAQNVNVVREHRGIMYFANISGVLEYDGVSWRLITTPNNSAVFTLGIDKNGVVYAGGEVELGYLAPDSLGQMRYISLVNRLPPENQDFVNILRIMTTSHGTYFVSLKFLFRLENITDTADSSSPSAEQLRQFRIWQSETQFQSAFAVRDTIYVPQVGVGLMKLVGDSLHLVAGGQYFKDVGIKTMIPMPASERDVQDQSEAGHHKPKQKILIGLVTSNLLLYDGESLEPFKTEADVFLKTYQISRGVNLVDGMLALGTHNGGVAIIDGKGRLRQIVNKAVGLRSNHVNALYSDPADGALWVALDNGLARVNTPAPVTTYSEKLGISNSVRSIVRFQNRIYAATHQGIFYLSVPQTRDTYPIFKAVAGISAYCGEMLLVENTLLAATTTGVYRIEGNRSTQISDLNTILLHQSQRNPKLVYIGGGTLARVQKIGGQWQFTGASGLNKHVISIVEEDEGILWLGTRVEGLLRVETSASTFQLPTDTPAFAIQRYGPEQGIPTGKVYVCSVNDRILVATSKGLRRFEQQSRSFIPDSSFGTSFADTTRYLDKIVRDVQGRLWVPGGDQDGYEIALAVPGNNGSYERKNIPSLQLADMRGAWAIFPEPNGVAWFGSDEGIVRFDPTVLKNDEVNFSTAVRRVVVNGDSTIYWGAEMKPYDGSQPSQGLKLLYSHNTIRFEFAALSYDDPTRNQYQVFLEGFDAGWSGWTGETKKDYTNLPEGDYRFRVRAENIYKYLSSEGRYEFSILPPWYRTNWAYAFCAVILGLLFYGTGRFQIERMQRQHLNELVHIEHNKLKEMDRLKSDFFANISHEFRTPLTLVLGPLKDALAKSSEHISFTNLKMMRRNADRLLRLINQLLDLSKLQTDKMELRTSPGDIVLYVKGLTMSFESLAAQKNISLQFEVSSGEYSETEPVLTETYFDRDKIEKIFSNLLSNAFKFTPAQGKISVTCRMVVADFFETTQGQSATGSKPCVEVTIKDSGMGIAADRLPHIFDRFYQVDTSSTRENEGTGIGLALVKELVHLHHGSIEVESEVGRGTTFVVCLPLGRNHLLPEEIIGDVGTADIPLNPPSKGDFETSPIEEDTQPCEGLDPSQGFDENTSIILIVEDNADVRSYIHGSLEGEYKILEAKDGEQGIDEAIENIPDLVICDVMMPKKNGYEVCAALKSDERTSHIPVILLTAKATADEKIAGLETGADDYLIKPFDSKELRVRVKNLISLRKKLRQRFSTATIIKPREVSAVSMDQDFLQRVIDTIEAQLADEDFNINTLGKTVGMSPSQINRKLNALIDQSGGQLIRSMRLHRAANLLKQKAGNVTEICFEVGFNNLTTFNRSFKKQFGVSPNQYHAAE